jgi:sulfate transport system ATP-binding protein
MALARALAVEPRVLLLDEPFGALDARVRQELRTWLLRLHDEVQVTTVLVTHDQEEAMEVASSIVVMNHGRIEQSGTPEHLYDYPGNEFVMSFIGHVNKVGDAFIRPHDVEIRIEPNGTTEPASIDRLVRLGFEVRAELTLNDGRHVRAQLTRDEVMRLGLQEDQTVYVSLDRGRVFENGSRDSA